MLDCGFSVKETVCRLQRLGKTGDDLSAILVTHEHGDHIRGVGALARQFSLPVWMTMGTYRAVEANIGTLPKLNIIDLDSDIDLGDLHVHPYAVPHDAREPVQFVLGNGDRRLGILTDSGTITPHIENALDGCDALVIECNHDSDMLINGNYPPSLIERVGGSLGHLDNEAAAGLLDKLDTGQLQHLVAAHLSEKNNTPALVRWALSDAIGCAEDWIAIAHQDHGLPWRELA